MMNFSKVFSMFAKKMFLLVLFTCLLVGSAWASSTDPSPTDRVRTGVKELIKVLSDPEMQNITDHDAAIARLLKVSEKYIDFREVTKMSIGRPWLKMSPQMQTKLTAAFIQLLERSYLKRIPAYGGQNVIYKNELISGRKAKVLTEIIDKDKKIVVEFRLKFIQGQWMIYDLVAEGVSLVGNYRSQFSQVLHGGTPEDLLQLILERVKKIDEKKLTEDEAES
jgi:phospholipid transport system substrate-binding protein